MIQLTNGNPKLKLKEPYRYRESQDTKIYFGYRYPGDPQRSAAYKRGPSLDNYKAVQQVVSDELAPYGIKLGSRINTGFLGAVGWLEAPSTAEGKAAHEQLLKSYNADKAVVKITTDPAEATVAEFLFNARRAIETERYGTNVGMGRAFPAMLPRLGPVFSITMPDTEGDDAVVYLIPREDLIEFGPDFADTTGAAEKAAKTNLLEAVLTVAREPRYNLCDLSETPDRGNDMKFEGVIDRLARKLKKKPHEVLGSFDVQLAFKDALAELYPGVLGQRLESAMRGSGRVDPTRGTFEHYFTKNGWASDFMLRCNIAEVLRMDLDDNAQPRSSYFGFGAYAAVLMSSNPNPVLRNVTKDKYKAMRNTLIEQVKLRYRNTGWNMPADSDIGGGIDEIFLFGRNFYLLAAEALGDDPAMPSKEVHDFLCGFLRGAYAVFARWCLDAVDLMQFTSTFSFTIDDLHLANIGLTTSMVLPNPVYSMARRGSGVPPAVAAQRPPDTSGPLPRPRMVLRDLGFFGVGQVPNMTLDYSSSGESSLAGFRRSSGRARRSR